MIKKVIFPRVRLTYDPWDVLTLALYMGKLTVKFVIVEDSILTLKENGMQNLFS